MSNEDLEQKDRENSQNTQKNINQDAIPIKELFRYATSREKIIVCFAVLLGFLNGITLPLMFIGFGRSFNSLIEYERQMYCEAGPNKTGCDTVLVNNEVQEGLIEDQENEALEVINLMCIVGAAVFIVGGLSSYLAGNISEKVVNRTKIEYFKAIIRQEQGFYETEQSSSQLLNILSDSFDEITEGINDNIVLIMQSLAEGVSGIIIGAVMSWELCLVLLASSPVMLIIIKHFITFQVKMELEAKESYDDAGQVATETIENIRTVKAFGIEKYLTMTYDRLIQKCTETSKKHGNKYGIMLGLIYGFIFLQYTLAFGFGTWIYLKERADPGEILTGIFSILVAGQALSGSEVHVSRLNKARTAAKKILEICDRRSKIDALSEAGVNLEPSLSSKLRIEFRNVKFTYPSRPDVQVLNSINLVINEGETIALVGESGSGKSSIIKLLQRLYDIDNGHLLVDNQEIKHYRVSSLRSNIGVVGQEPVLFSASIKDNIAAGKIKGEPATDQEIIEALKQANAYNFVKEFSHGIETFIHRAGANLSGGQKQRIAIARAIIGNPKILLLDEATSALDSEGEVIVQKALDKARMNRTTVIVAHRLSTIRYADRIIGIKNGEIVEEGTHDELYKRENGLYRALYDAQGSQERQKDTNVSFKDETKISDQSKEATLTKMTDETSKTVVEKSSLKSIGEKNLPKVSHLEIFALQKPELFMTIIGTINGAINGVIQVIYALMFANILNAYAKPSEDSKGIWDVVWEQVIILISITTGSVAVQFFRYVPLERVVVKLTRRFRFLYFQKLLTMEMGLFDDVTFPSGLLLSRLFVDCKDMTVLTTHKISILGRAAGALICGLIFGFTASWQVSLAAMAFLPLQIYSHTAYINRWINSKQTYTSDQTVDDIYQNDPQTIAYETLLRIATVASTSQEKNIINNFTKTINEAESKEKGNNYYNSFINSIRFASQYFNIAICVRVGVHLIINTDDLNLRDFSIAFMFVIFGAREFSAALYLLMKTTATSMLSAQRVKYMLDRESLEQQPMPDSEGHINQAFDDSKSDVPYIEFQNVNFAYPSRPNLPVLTNTSFKIYKNECVGLVGQSGSGKSTCVQLLERFYTPDSGKILINGQDIANIDIKDLRKQLGLVQQEPDLFDMSIEDNILLGKGEIMGEVAVDRHEKFDKVVHKDLISKSPQSPKINAEPPSFTSVHQAAKLSNIQNFIKSLPNQYSTKVGPGGNQLSGGQKQRLAIARTLLRNPPILLLDEATSALDNESEKLVNKAINEARKGRTVLFIAHRLSTVRTADRVVVMESGRVVEDGVYEDLVKRQGVFYNLMKAQI